MENNTPIEKPKAGFAKKFLKIILYSFLAILALLLAAIGLLFVYEDEVKSAIVSELNKHLKAEVKVAPENIDLTIIRSFPDCSMDFKEVLMLEALKIKKRDTLFYAGNLSLRFNIKNIWNKKYEIEKIKFQDGVIKLKVFKNGSNNYTFWNAEEANAQEKSDSLQFNLNALTVEKSRFSYQDKSSSFETASFIEKLRLSGNFSQTDYILQSEGKAFITKLNYDEFLSLKNKNLNFLIDLDIKGDNYLFKRADLNLNQLAFNLNGDFKYKDSLEYLKLNYYAPKLDIASILSMLPEEQKSRINDYESTGNFSVKGSLSYLNNHFETNTNFGISNGEITYIPKSTTAKQVNLEGSLKYSKNVSVLSLKNVRLKLNDDEIAGNFSLNDFSNPYINLSISANNSLETLQNFWPIDTITTIKGNIRLLLNAAGLVEDFKNRTFSEKVKLKLEAGVTGLEMQFKNDEKLYAIENCSISAIEREIEVRDLKLKRGNSDINVSGKIPGVFNYLMDKSAPLIINGTLSSQHLELEDFINGSKDDSHANNNPLIPDNTLFKLDAVIKEFSFAKFKANNITGDIEVKNQRAMVSNMKLQTMEGEAEINAYADNSKGKMDVALVSSLKNINVNQLFYQFNNFGQQTLQDKNIKGYISADIDFSGLWNNRLEVDYKSIKSVCNLNIDRGELLDFKPLEGLSKFVSISELKKIKFSSLQGNLEIHDNTIFIPRTVIDNSALNIEFWGKHTFDNEIDYHIQLVVDELLTKKRTKTDDEFGPVVNDNDKKRSAFVLMTGTVDDPKYKYDRKGQKEKIKQDIKNEKQTMKQILKEEFGWFKKDTIPQKKNKTENILKLEKPNSNTKKKPENKKTEEEDGDF